MMRLKGRASPATFKAALPLEYVVKFIIMLVALSVISMIIINFQSLYPQPSPDDKKPLEAFPIIQNKSQFTREEVARNIGECYSALSGVRPTNLAGKVCYIMQSGQGFEFAKDSELRPLLNPNLPVEYNISPESKILTVLFDFTGKKIILRSQAPERPSSPGSRCANRNESCSGAQCCRNLFCRENLSGEGKACCKSTECLANGTCANSGTCSRGNVCVRGTWKTATANETVCNDGIDNDCDGLVDMRDLDCILKSCKVTTTIKDALEKLAGKCPVINVPAGTYREGWIDIPANVHLKGAGESTVVILPANKGCGDYIFRVNADNVTIEGMSLDGDRANQGERPGCEADYGVFVGGERLPLPLPNANNVLVKDMIIKNMAGDGVYVGIAGTITNVTITKSTISNNFRNGISLTNGDKLYITDNYVDGSMGYWGGGLAVDVEPEIVGWVSNAYIQNNRYKGVIEGSRYCRGRCSNIVVSGNIQQ